MIKAGVSQRPMRIVVRLTEKQLLPHRAGRRDRRAVSAGLFLRARARRAAQCNPDAYCFARTGNPRQWRRAMRLAKLNATRSERWARVHS